jgi:restriction system-associated AAA family ATPase
MLCEGFRVKLLRVHIVAATTCGGLLDGFDISLRSPSAELEVFDPMCLIGPNGAGKSQFLQVIAEMFQSIFHAVVPTEERLEGNKDLQFELEYLIRPEGAKNFAHVRAARLGVGKRKPSLVIQQLVDGAWIEQPLNDESTRALLPKKLVGYTSGDNETMSLPFFLSRSGYADEVGKNALSEDKSGITIPDTRLMLIDYGTHLEVLVANLLLGENEHRTALLQDARLDEINSFRCVVQLAHRAVPRNTSKKVGVTRKGVQLTQELESYLEQLKRCATCYDIDTKTETYTFDFLVDEQTKLAFGFFWRSSLDLYSSFHKLAMLNDLAIPKITRDRFRKDTKARRFASRLPEPQDEQKVFRFEQVNFISKGGKSVVDYVSLSDGEHQLAQLLGTFCMTSFSNVLFLLDEPESHFNPQWRVKFISRLRDLPTSNGRRSDVSPASMQDCLLTTHAPFVPSDMAREKVVIFGKNAESGDIEFRHPDTETYGATFDAILAECFNIRPPISEVPRQDIQALMKSSNLKEIEAGMNRLGHSVQKVMLADRLRRLENKGDA